MEERVFQRPSSIECIKAIGDLKPMRKDDREQLEKLRGYFKRIPEPAPGDWLSEINEPGQSFAKFSVSAPRTLIDKKKSKLYLQPLEAGIDEVFVQKLRVFAEAFFFGMEVRFLPLFDIEAQKDVRSRKPEGSRRVKQFNGSDILSILRTKKPTNAHCLIGICLSDLYNGPNSNYVFGLASLTEHVGVFSFARYLETFYFGGSPETNNKDLIVYRSCKVMCHELVHQFGIKHCIYYHCLMNGSNHYEEAGSKPYDLCPVCLRKLHSVLQFDMQQRYEALEKAARLLESKYFDQEAFFYKHVRLEKPESTSAETEVTSSKSSDATTGIGLAINRKITPSIKHVGKGVLVKLKTNDGESKTKKGDKK